MQKKYSEKSKTLFNFYNSINEDNNKWTESEFKSFILDKNNLFLLSKPIPVGYIKARILQEEIEIVSIFIEKKHRGKGNGKALLNILKTIAKKNKIKKILLEVSIENHAALNLYKSFNFKVVGNRKGYYKKNGRKIDAYIMMLSLSRNF